MQKVTALYSRSARDNQQSINNQKAILEKYCKDNDIVNFKNYVDNNESGATLNRPSLNELLNDSNDGKINKVIVTSITRISRSATNPFGVMKLLVETNAPEVIILDELGTEKQINQN